MARNSVLHRSPPPLPERIADWERVVETERTLNDLVEDVHRLLVDENEVYRKYLYAVYDEQAVEGSLAIDNGKAAEIIRLKAQSVGNTEVASQKLATIVKALNVVLRRYNKSRKQRRNMIHGEIVSNDDSE